MSRPNCQNPNLTSTQRFGFTQKWLYNHHPPPTTATTRVYWKIIFFNTLFAYVPKVCDWVWVNKRKKWNSNLRPGTVSEMAPKICPFLSKKKVPPKYPKTAEKWQYFILPSFQEFFDIFSAQENRINFSFCMASGVTRSKFRKGTLEELFFDL